MVARNTSSLWQPGDLSGIPQIPKGDQSEQNYLTGSMPLHTHNHNFKACGGPVASPLPQMSKNVVGKYGAGNMELHADR